MSEPLKVLVLLWTEDDGTPNCNIYRNALTIDNPDDLEIAQRAIANPGEAIPVTGDPDNKTYYKYTTVIG